MKKVVALMGVLAAILLFFWFNQKGEVKEQTTADFFAAGASRTERRFFY